MARRPVSDHFDGTHFFNPHAVAGRTWREVVHWARTRQRAPWPASVRLAPQAPPPSRVAPGQVAITFIGHSTFLVRTATNVFITDPVFTPHAGPFGRTGPRRVRPPAIALADLPSVDVVLLSHNHYDHLQPSSLAALVDATIVTTLGVGRYIPPKGGNHVASAFRRNLARRDVHELDWWEHTQIGDARVTAVPAQHFSARTPWDKNRTLWCGFVIQTGGVRVYFAGDTGYTPQFTGIGAHFEGIDVALLPIGAYEPRWFMKPMHMNPEEAVRAHLDVRARVSIGMHFGTFQLTDEPIDEPLRALDRARGQHGVSADAFRVLPFGATEVFAGTRADATLRHEDREGHKDRGWS